MGIGSFLKKAAGGIIGATTGALGGLLGTGDSSARRAGQAGADQTAALFKEYLGLLKPGIEQGTGALKGLGQYSSAEGLGNLYDSISGSELATSMMADRERAAGQALAGAGLRRSGAAAREAASIPTDVISQIMSTIMGNQQNIASLGLGQGSTALSAVGGFGDAMNQKYQIQQGGADRKSGILGGLLNAGGSILGGLFSDPRLKTNVEVVGQIGPLALYTWDWVEGAEELGVVMNHGFMADEVAEHYPQHVYPVEVSGVELLTVDYGSLLNDLGVENGL